MITTTTQTIPNIRTTLQRTFSLGNNMCKDKERPRPQITQTNDNDSYPAQLPHCRCPGGESPRQEWRGTMCPPDDIINNTNIISYMCQWSPDLCSIYWAQPGRRKAGRRRRSRGGKSSKWFSADPWSRSTSRSWWSCVTKNAVVFSSRKTQNTIS